MEAIRRTGRTDPVVNQNSMDTTGLASKRQAQGRQHLRSHQRADGPVAVPVN